MTGLANQHVSTRISPQNGGLFCRPATEESSVHTKRLLPLTQDVCATTCWNAVNCGLPFARGVEAGTAEAVPGAVRVPGQAAVSTGRAVGLAAVQRDLRQPQLRADVQLLLPGQTVQMSVGMLLFVKG